MGIVGWKPAECRSGGDSPAQAVITGGGVVEVHAHLLTLKRASIGSGCSSSKLKQAASTQSRIVNWAEEQL